MGAFDHDIPDLELVLLRRGVGQRDARRERCGRCDRTPLVGERIYVYEGGATLCELCRLGEREAPARSRLIHGPEFGPTIKVGVRRVA
ncbi:MAG: hypothetical protein JO168_12215 [Solirubrobacterales bacterium]|nr:hypothetical protein [Solirubrobacterales bacterium]